MIALLSIALIPGDLETSAITMCVEWNRDGVHTFRQRDTARLSLHSVLAVLVHNKLAVNDGQRTVTGASLAFLEALVTKPFDRMKVHLMT